MNFMSNSETMKSKIEKPIFIIGAPRSGTQLLYVLLGQHSDLGWFSTSTGKKFFSDDYLRSIYLRRRIFGLRKIPHPIDNFTLRFFSTIEPPTENGPIWDMVFEGNWDAKISKKNLEIVKNEINEILQNKKKKRFLSKYPRNSIKISLINKAFPNSKFVHIIRDGRAVVNSMIQRSKENPSGYFGIPLKPSEKKEMNQIEKHALQWTQVIEEIRNASKNLMKNQYFEIKYEDLVRNTEECLNQITSFCELPSFNFVFRKDNVIRNSADKEPFGWELMDIPNIQNRNVTHDNDPEFEKYLSKTLRELNYA